MRLLPEEAECILRNASIDGFGGRCACAALAINRVIFNYRGRYLAAYNLFLWDTRRYWIGHVVIEDKNGQLWDSKGRLSWEEFEGWGRPEHLYLVFPDEVSYEEVMVERMSGRKLQTTCDSDMFDDMVERLTVAATSYIDGEYRC